MESNEDKARNRATVIMKVRSGEMTAAAGAASLGVSRKTYYEWENRALAAMAQALVERPTGRPFQEKDLEKEALQGRIKDLEGKLFLAEKTIEVKNLLRAYDEHRAKKKTNHEKKI